MLQDSFTINNLSDVSIIALVLGVILFSIWFFLMMRQREKEFPFDDVTRDLTTDKNKRAD